MKSIKNYISLFAIGVFTLIYFPIKGQNQIEIDEAVKIAWENNPSIKEALLEVEKAKSLTKAYPGINKTSLAFQNGQINSSIIDYSFEISQGFSFPTAKAYKALQNSKVELSENNLGISKNDLARNVRDTYTQVSNTQEKLILYETLVNLYKKMKQVAEKKFAAGETSVLEKTFAISKYEESMISKSQLEAELNLSKNTLALLLNNGNKSVDVVKPILQLPILDSTEINNNPLLSYYSNNIELKNKDLILSKKMYLPDFNVGYFNQQIDGAQGFQGFNIGINVPIFYRSTKANIKAAKIETEIAESQLNGIELELNRLFQKRINAFNKYQLEVEYYTSTGSLLEQQLIEFSTKSYETGEIGYLEYLENIHQATLIKTHYLESLQAMNSEVIEIMYLIGK